MIGAASMTWRPPAGPASTGQQPAFSHAPTSGRAHSGESVIEMNAPPDTVMIMWTATRAAGSASSRLAPRPGPDPAAPAGLADSFATATISRTARHGPGRGRARTDTDPASGARRRTTRAPEVV